MFLFCKVGMGDRWKVNWRGWGEDSQEGNVLYLHGQELGGLQKEERQNGGKMEQAGLMLLRPAG